MILQPYIFSVWIVSIFILTFVVLAGHEALPVNFIIRYNEKNSYESLLFYP